MKSARLSVSHAAPPFTPARPLDPDLRGYLQSNADVVQRITKPVSLDYIPALSAASNQPVLFENIVEKPGFRLCDILVKHRDLQARALGVTREDYLRTLAYRLRRPPRGFVNVADGPVKERKLLGKVKTRDQLTEIGAEVFEGSMIIGDDAYDVIPGFVGTPVGAPVQTAPNAEAGEEDLLAQFLIKSL